MNKKKIAGILGGIVFLVAASGGSYQAYANYLDNNRYQEAQRAIDHLFQDKNHLVLTKNANSSVFKADQAKIEIITDNEKKAKLATELKKAVKIFNTELKVKINVSSLLNKGVLVDEVTKTQLEDAQKQINSLTDKEMKKSLQQILDNAKQQFTVQQKAEQALKALFTDNAHQALADKVSRDTYNQAKQLVAAVTNESKKKEWENLLAKADALLTKAESEKAQAEARAKATNAAGTSQSTSSQSQPNNGSSSVSAAGGAQETGFAKIVADSRTAQQTDQIVTVVASGTSANVTLWEKANNQWGAVFSTGGMVGYEGVGQAHEGSGRTPRGSYSLGFAFGQYNPGTQLQFRQITPNSYWISDVNSPLYNTWQEGNYPGNGNEHLADYENLQYYYAIVINYNTSAVKGAGSGFFLHVSNGQPTAGCVAVPKSYMEQFMKRIHPGAYIINVTSEAEVANY